MNKLIELYNQISATPSVSTKYKSIGASGLGNIFSFINTNYRQILSPPRSGKYGGFAKGYEVIEAIENIPRANWTAKNSAGQEKEKQHTVRIRCAELFMCDIDTYKSTSRGKVFKKMYTSSNLSYEEKRLLCYFIILSGYFNVTPNYIFRRTKAVFESLFAQGLSENYILEQMEIAIKTSSQDEFKKQDIFDLDYLYIDSFAFDPDGFNFLPVFIASTKSDIAEFKNNIKSKYTNNGADILSKKYENGGNYTPDTLIENAWILSTTYKLLQSKINSFDCFVNSMLDIYGSLFPIDNERVKTFIYNTDMNQSVFRVIYSKLYDVPLHKDAIKDLTIDEINALGRIDGTDEQGSLQLEQIVSSLKKLAKELTNYRCGCHSIENCRYFTARENGKRYLEIHHFIPREFANDFDTSIEIIENYVPLCPNCHRKIHNAVDGERKHLINNLLSLRKDSLKNKRIEIDEDQIYKYYRVAE